jgi:hypothetical protein
MTIKLEFRVKENKANNNTNNTNNTNNNTNSIQYNSILYYLCTESQPQGQLQTQHSTDIHIYIMDTHNIKSRVNCKST